MFRSLREQENAKPKEKSLTRAIECSGGCGTTKKVRDNSIIVSFTCSSCMSK